LPIAVAGRAARYAAARVACRLLLRFTLVDEAAASYFSMLRIFATPDFQGYATPCCCSMFFRCFYAEGFHYFVYALLADDAEGSHAVSCHYAAAAARRVVRYSASAALLSRFDVPCFTILLSMPLLMLAPRHVSATPSRQKDTLHLIFSQNLLPSVLYKIWPAIFRLSFHPMLSA